MALPAIILIPGAGALPEFYDPITKVLTDRGFTIRALQLPSVSLPTDHKDGPLPTLYDDSVFIAKHVIQLSHAGQDVILVTHSYGGSPATECVRGLTKKERQVRGLKGGIVGIAYMTSLVPNVGETAGAVLATIPEEDRVPMAPDEYGWLAYTDLPRLAELTFSNLSKEDAAYWAQSLVLHSAAAFATPITHAGFKDVPISYLVCENDLTIPARIQRAGIEMIERESGNKVEVTSIGADHAAPLSFPDEVVDWVYGVVRRVYGTNYLNGELKKKDIETDIKPSAANTDIETV